MGAKEEREGTTVRGPAILGEPWWLISQGGIDVCCHRAAGWFDARDIGRALTGEENVQAKLMERWGNLQRREVERTRTMTQEKQYANDCFEWRLEEEGIYDVLDHGCLKVKRVWGSDEEIIETARMSTGKGFLGWDPGPCPSCAGSGSFQAGQVEAQCHDCGGKGTIPGDAKLLRYLHEKGHSTPFEFAGLTIEVQAPLMVFREWHRHRVPFGYSEMSARYVQMPNLHYVPSVRRIIESSKKSGNRQASGGGAISFGEPSVLSQEEMAESIRQYIRGEQQRIYTLYEQLLSYGVSKEIARLDTPVSRYSRMRVTGNLRGWLGFLTLRMAPDAQFEIRQFAWCVGDAIERAFPRTWGLFFERMALRL